MASTADVIVCVHNDEHEDSKERRDMPSRTNRPSRHDSPNDVGTLWTLQRASLTARCALLSWPEVWEVKVLIDGQTLTSYQCDRTDDAFAMADRWRLNLLAQSWQQVVPRLSQRESLDAH